MIIYMVLEAILFIAIIFYKIFIGDTWVLQILTFLPIILTSIILSFRIKKGKDEIKPIYLIGLLAVLGDLCFIYFNKVYGIYFFFLIQLCLIYYLNRNKIKILSLVIIAGLILVQCYLLNNKYLIVEGILYVGTFLFNLVSMMKKIKFNEQLNILLVAFIFLSICDFNVMLIYLMKEMNVSQMLANICFIIEWFFYIGFQIFIVLYSANFRKKIY